MVTLLNSWQLFSAREGGLCVSDLLTSAPLLPLPVSFLSPVAVLSSLIELENSLSNNLPPRSPSTTPAFHHRHCFSLLPLVVLFYHGNSPPTHLPRPICGSACHVSIHKGAGGNSTVCGKYMMHSFCVGLSPQLLTADLGVTMLNNLSVGGHWLSSLADD